MAELVLHPDVQFNGPADIEAAAYGTAFQVHASLSRDLSQISDEVWGRAAGLVCYHEVTVTAELLDRMPNCRVVVRAGVGFDNIDLDAAGARGIAVCNRSEEHTSEL